MTYRHIFILAVLLTGCSREKYDQSDVETNNPLFVSMQGPDTGIDFANMLHEQEDFDVFRYRNYYNGGGVGIIDVNNDGLADLFLTSNMDANRLFLNKGNWKFEDITDKAGVRGSKIWSTGVSIADVTHYA